MKNILITGSNGFISRSFIQKFRGQYNFILLSHKRTPSHITLEKLESDENLVSSIDLILNLSGANISEKRWTGKRKRELLESRIFITKKIVSVFNATEHKPHLISASAVGIYDENLNNDESTEIDYYSYKNFSQEITKKWELAAREYQGPLTITRFGVVLGNSGGAFPKILKPFLMYLGIILSNGSQWMTWITTYDLLKALDYIITNQHIGIYNLVAPEVTTNLQLATTISKTWNKPIIGKMPALIIRILFGQMGQELFLNSIKVSPQKLIHQGFIFKYPNIAISLNAIKNKDLD